MDMRTVSPSVACSAAELRAQVAHSEALAMMVPQAQWLVRSGVTYTSFALALKGVFIEAARRDLRDAGAKVTDSALSVLSGVQRRDIREMNQDSVRDIAPKTPSVASQAFTRWLTDPQFRGKNGRPLTLDKTGEPASFDTLARSVSSDVHPRTLLSEMERLGLVQVRNERVALSTAAFVPNEGFAELAELFSANVADHMAAAVHNLSGRDDRFLEQSVFASGLSAESVEALGVKARQLWGTAFDSLVQETSQRYQRDQHDPSARMRMRFGIYYFHEPDNGPERDEPRPLT